MARRKKRRTRVSIQEHSYVVVLFVLVVFLFTFAFVSPVSFGGDITGFQALNLVETSPQVAVLSFFGLLFGIFFLMIFTFNLLSRVL